MILLIKGSAEQAFDALQKREIDGRLDHTFQSWDMVKVVAPPQQDLDRKTLAWFAEDAGRSAQHEAFPPGSLLWFKT